MRALLLGCFTAICFTLVAGVAFAGTDPSVVAPHVVTGADTDSCAMCHRAHTSASGTTWASQDASPTQQSALLTGVGDYDITLCYVCHGTDLLGSGTDVQTAFTSGSGHALAPATSAYGPERKECSDCHDSHGTARTASGTPYPALLRSFDASKTAVYRGDAYCATCHGVRAGNTWDGLGVWKKTAHASLPAPASGTGIVCSDCHDPHGSSVAPTLLTSIVPPASSATVTVTANDRQQCLACHASSAATWVGGATYAASSHAASLATVAIPGEWPADGSSRRVGECQVCHNPMGEDDGTGNPVPKLARASGAALCYQCHGPAGPATTDIQTAMAGTPAAPTLEVVASFGATSSLSAYGQVLAYTQDATATVPRALVGPRAFRGTGHLGATAAGDINGDGRAELLVADPTDSRIDVFSYDALRGLSDRVGPGVLPIDASADFIGIGDVVVDGSGLPEVVVVDMPAGDLYVYRFTNGALQLVQPAIPVGAVTGMAIGDVRQTDPDPGSQEVILTLSSNALTIMYANMGALQPGDTYATLAGPRSPSIGDVWPGGTNDIVVLNSEEAVDTVSVFGGSGGLLGSFAAGQQAGEVPTASGIGDILPSVTPAGTSGLEVAVTYADPAGLSQLAVFPLDASIGLGTPTLYAIGDRYNPTDVAIGDADGDARSELVLANAGAFTRDTAQQLASLLVFKASTAGDTLLAPETKWAGGVELAGGAAGVEIADFGALGTSGHPVGAVPRTHVSTETAVVARHVECEDCHNSHEADNTTTHAPDAQGSIKGAWGVSVQNDSATKITLTEQRGVRYEYELCLKCHSQWSVLDGDTDVAALVNTENASVHAVEAPSSTSQAPAGSFTDGWTNDSVMYCTACHGDSRLEEPIGPHRSPDAPALIRPYWGLVPGDGAGLCYDCHVRQVYFQDTAPASPNSLFSGSTGHQALHPYHTNDLGFGCAACHVSHGAQTEPRLLRADVGYSASASGGSCTNACHVGGLTKTYVRP